MDGARRSSRSRSSRGAGSTRSKRETGPLALFDAHTHFGRNDPDGFRQEPAQLLAAMELRRAPAPSPSRCTSPAATRAANDEALAVGGGLRRARSSPSAGSTRTTARSAEARRCLDAGARGIKLHPRAEQFAMHEPAVEDAGRARRRAPRAGPDPRRPRHPGARRTTRWSWPSATPAPASSSPTARSATSPGSGASCPRTRTSSIDTSWWNPADLRRPLLPGAARPDPLGQRLPLRARRCNSAAFQLRCALAAGLGPRRSPRSPAARSSASSPARSRPTSARRRARPGRSTPGWSGSTPTCSRRPAAPSARPT